MPESGLAPTSEVVEDTPNVVADIVEFSPEEQARIQQAIAEQALAGCLLKRNRIIIDNAAVARYAEQHNMSFDRALVTCRALLRRHSEN